MAVVVETRQDHQRGCGWRKPGGLYLVSGGVWEDCARLPLEMSTCPCCGEGIKPARGWTYIDGEKMFGHEAHGDPGHSAACPLGESGADLSRAGLLWVGEKHYGSPQEFMAEALQLGVSRRITQVPKDLVVGETFVFMAHRKAVTKSVPLVVDEARLQLLDPEAEGPAELVQVPGVFTVFRPTAIEYVTRGDESEEELEALVKRGITPVRVERVGDDRAVEQVDLLDPRDAAEPHSVLDLEDEGVL